MPDATSPLATPPRITYLRIRNYRALRDVEFRDLTPLTVLIGANGSGKSTVLDALAFLEECARGRLQEAWRTRNGLSGIKPEGGSDKIAFECQIAFAEGRATYKLALGESDTEAIVRSERILDADDPNSTRDDVVGLVGVVPSAEEGKNLAISQSGDWFSKRVEKTVARIHQGLISNDDLWLSFPYQLGRSQGDDSPHPEAISSFFKSGQSVHFTDSHASGSRSTAPAKRLSLTGDNLANVLFYLKKTHPALLEELLQELRHRVPRLESITVEETIDKRLVLRLKDQAFAEPIPARFASDGTLRLLAYLVLLNEPEPAGLLGVEEPEAEIHPSLHGRLAEDFIRASARTQLFVTTHSPQFLDALEPEEVWVLDRTPDGYTRATRAADIYNVKQRIDNGSSLGALWLEGRLNPDIPQPPNR